MHVLFIFLPTHAYMLYTFLFTRCHHHDGVSKQASASLAPLLQTIHKEEMIGRQKK